MANAIGVVRAQGETLDCRLGGLLGLRTRHLPGLVGVRGELRHVQDATLGFGLLHAETHSTNGIIVDQVGRLGRLQGLDVDVKLGNQGGEVLLGSLARLEETVELRGGILLQGLVVGSRDDLGRIPDVRVKALRAQGLLNDRLRQERTDGMLSTDEVEPKMVDRAGVLAEIPTHAGRLQLTRGPIRLQEQVLLNNRDIRRDDLGRSAALHLRRCMRNPVSSRYGRSGDGSGIGSLGQGRNRNCGIVDARGRNLRRNGKRHFEENGCL